MFVQSVPWIMDHLPTVQDLSNSCQSQPSTWWILWAATLKSIIRSTPEWSWELTLESMKLSTKNGFQINQDKPSMVSKDKEFWPQCWERVKTSLNTHGKMLWPLSPKELTMLKDMKSQQASESSKALKIFKPWRTSWTHWIHSTMNSVKPTSSLCQTTSDLTTFSTLKLSQSKIQTWFFWSVSTPEPKPQS